MTGALLAGLVAGCVVLIAEGYVLLGRQARQANVNDQILEAARQLLAAVPGKSATRTDGSGQQPHRWWQRLTDLTAPVLDEEPATDEIPVISIEPAQRPQPLRTDTADSLHAVDGAVTRVLDTADLYGRHAHGTRP